MKEYGQFFGINMCTSIISVYWDGMLFNWETHEWIDWEDDVIAPEYDTGNWDEDVDDGDKTYQIMSSQGNKGHCHNSKKKALLANCLQEATPYHLVSELCGKFTLDQLPNLIENHPFQCTMIMVD